MFTVWKNENKPTLLKAIEWKKACEDNKYMVWMPECQIFFNNLDEVEYYKGYGVRREIAAMKDLWYENK